MNIWFFLFWLSIMGHIAVFTMRFKPFLRPKRPMPIATDSLLRKKLQG